MSLIKVEDVAHVRFAAPDLDAMRAFLEDFGMTVVTQDADRLVMGGCGHAPFLHVTERGAASFKALAFRAGSLADLEILAGADGVAVEALDAPGGGYVVRLSDPDGHGIEVVAGRRWRHPPGSRPARRGTPSRPGSANGRSNAPALARHTWCGWVMGC